VAAIAILGVQGNNSAIAASTIDREGDFRIFS
jgi:hypothetical protein